MLSVHSQNNEQWIKQSLTFKSASVFNKLSWMELLHFSVASTRLNCLHSALLSEPDVCIGNMTGLERALTSGGSFHRSNSGGSRWKYNTSHSNTSCRIFCKDPQCIFIVGHVVCLKKCVVFLSLIYRLGVLS